MKRYRAVDVPPKFRRTAKGRNTRLGDSVYFNRFFSAYNLVYLKFFLMWVCCITLDFLIGFRFELLWPVWLLVRHLYESFRVHAFSSSLHYSAFSVFFVCVTATSDLVCYLFIPIQVLIFLASTYVWVQFVYQSSDRGVCLPSLFLWALFIVFEYSVRYRFDNATWYLTRTSWITAGLFPSTADSVSIGLSGGSSSSSASPSSTRLELYRPFAAHCIGFPVVTLGFRVKSFFSNWRMRIRREEVMRQNEFFERLLADAIPTSFESRKHFISSRSHLSIDQDVFDYDAVYSTSDLLNGFEANSQQPRLYSVLNSSSSIAAICAPPSCGNSSSSLSQQYSSTSNAKKHSKSLSKTQMSAPKQNGTAKRNELTPLKSSGWRPETNGANVFGKKALGEKRNSMHSIVPNVSSGVNRCESIFLKIWRIVVRFFCVILLSTFGQLLSTLTPSIQQALEGVLAQLRGSPTQQQDDMVSTSGEGSNVADEEEWEQESVHFQSAYTDHGSRKKSRRARGLSSVSQTSAAPNEPGSYTSSALINAQKTASAISNSSTALPSASMHKLSADLNDIGHASSLSSGVGQQHQETDNSDCSLLRENAQRLSEIRQLQKERQTLELSLDKLKGELKSARTGDHELRSQLSHAQRQEQSCREEWKQFEREQKQRVEQLESKCKQLSKQNDYYKLNTQALERRLGEMQLKKSEVERELTNERLRNARDDPLGKQQQNTSDNGELKQKFATQDREMKTLRKDVKTKNEQCTKLEDELRQLRSTKNDGSKQTEMMRQKNFLLEQTLSSENKLKQDLFRALNDSKAEVALLKARLHTKQTKEQEDMMSAFRETTASSSTSNSLFHGNGGTFGGSSSGSSPTAQQQRQFPISQRKSLTPPPLSVGSSTFNSALEQLLQATQNMSYSLSPLDSNGGVNTSECNNFDSSGIALNNNSSGSSPYIGAAASEMLAVGGHRSTTSTNAGGVAKEGNGN
ncbi:Transmembrane protein 57 [Globodera pallida]|nr:Transmembrane protein 57 [Globodera pallida]